MEDCWNSERTCVFEQGQRTTNLICTIYYKGGLEHELNKIAIKKKHAKPHTK